ncbi:MAG TPA: DinB family protein [Blastocatellia bacterium]|nr:DinB family protein [Blastocatellia bacterium]
MEAFKGQILNVRKFEFATTIKVLGAYPEDKLEMKPADKSRTARELIVTFIREEYVCRGAMRGDLRRADSPQTIPDSLVDMLDMLDQIHNEVQDMIAQADDEQLNRMIDFYGHQIRAIDALWAELHDQIHHRGQFSVYLRLAGAKVPSIYGPTADEPAGK